MKCIRVFFLFCFISISYAQQPKLVVPIGHTGSVNSIRFSPDGKKIATASDDKTAKLWDATTGKLLANFTDHNSNVASIDFSPDGKLLATASGDVIKVWDLSTGNLYAAFLGNIEHFNSVEFSPDGKSILGAIYNGKVMMWDVITQKLKWISGFEDFIRSGSIYFAHFAPDGSKIISNTPDNTIAVWDVVTGKLIMKLPKKTSWDYNQAIISHNGKYIFRWGLKDDFGDVFDLATGQELYTIKGNSWNIQETVFSLNDQFLVVPSIGSIAIWEVVKGKLINTIPGSYKSSTADRSKILLSRNDFEYWIINPFTSEKDIRLDLQSDKKRYETGTFSRNGKFVAMAHFNKSVEIYNTATGKLHCRLNGHTPKIEHLSLSPNGKQLLFSLEGKYLKTWNNESLEYTTITPKENENTQYPEYSPDGNYILAYDNDDDLLDKINLLKTINGNIIQSFSNPRGIHSFTNDSKFLAIVTNQYYTIEFWDLTKLTKIAEMPGDGREIKSIGFGPGNETLLVCYSDNTLALIDPFTFTILHQFKLDDNEGIIAKVSPDGKYIITTHYYSHEAKVWDIKTGNLVRIIEDTEGFICDFVFSNDASKIISLTHHGGDPKIFDIKTGKLVSTLIGHTEQTRFVLFYPDGNKAVTSSDDYTFRIWDVKTGKEIKKIDMDAHTPFSGLSFITKQIVSLANPEIKFFDLSSGRKQYTLLCIDSLDYIAITEPGYYKSTPNAAKYLHYVTKDSKVISFEQLDVKYNRPDKVLRAIGNKNEALIKSYRKAYEKRIRKLGIDTLAFREGYSVPESEFVNREAIEYEQKNEKLVLHIKGSDDTYKLDRYNVWVNEVPVFGMRGKNIREKNTNSIDTTLTITLSDGENRIETSITNVNATESYRMPLTVNYVPAVKQKETTHFIGIGIDKFADNRYNLNYSAKDIRDLVVKLKEKYREEIVIDTLFNENVTIANIKALKQKLLQTKENDKVIVAYSGHGLLSKDYDYYLSTYAINFEKPEDKGLAYDELENLLDDIPARKKLLLLDACHSGEVDKEELDKIKNLASEGSITAGAKGSVPIATADSGKIGMKNSFELMQELFVNVGRSTGATVISAAGGTQFALEKGDLKNGVFTYAILEFMEKKPEATISELKGYVNKRVPELTKGLQVPTTRTETNVVDWRIW